MISQIGNSARANRRPLNTRGLTFIEVMVTLIIFSVGIVGIFKTFIISLDQLNYLTDRLYASIILDNHITAIEHMLKVDRALPLETPASETLQMGSRKVVFEQELVLSAVEDFIDTFKLDLTLTWKEGTHQKHLSRSAFVNDLNIVYP